MNLRREKAATVATRSGLCLLALVTAASLFAVAPASANQLLGGTMSWKPRADISPNTVEFTVTCSFRLQDQFQSTGQAYGTPLVPTPTAVGDVFSASSVKSFDFGDGAGLAFPSSDIRWKAIEINVQQNYVVAQMLEKGSSTQGSFLHTFRNAGPWNVQTNNWCCRPEYDVKNKLRTVRLFARVETATGNQSPTLSSAQLPPGIVKVATGGLQPQQFLVTASDPDPNSVVTYRLATRLSGETGSFFYNPPDNLSYDAGSGLVSWDTGQPGISDGSGWSCAFVAEDRSAINNALQTSIMADVELVVEGISTGAPTFNPPSGSTLVVHVGTGMNTPISATDPHAAAPGNRVSIRATSLPSGASYASATNYGTVSSNLVWNPTNADAGMHTASFEAQGYAQAKGASVSATYNILVNRPPDISGASASIPDGPANHLFVPVTISGVTDPDGDSFTIAVTNIQQDEPVGDNCPDAILKPEGTGMVRRERLDEGPADGRVYTISFTATDSNGGTSSGTLTVCVPRTGTSCVDGGATYNSLECAPSLKGPSLESSMSSQLKLGVRLAAMRPGLATVEYTLPSASDVRLSVYDLAGRQMTTLASGSQSAGTHRVDWNTTGVAKGVYFYRLIANGETITKSILHLQ